MANNYNIEFPNNGSFSFQSDDDAWSEIDWSSLAVDRTNKFSTAHTSSSTSSTSPDSSFPSFITDTSIALPITQAWPPCAIIPQETQARPQHQHLDAFHNQSSTYIPGFGFSAPEEVSGIKLELHGLKYYQINPSRDPPYHVLLFTITVLRRDISRVDRWFYPYLWFSNGAPILLQERDYNNTISPLFVRAVMTALQSVGWKVGTLAHTVSYQEVLFFPDGNKKVVLHALAKKLGPPFIKSVTLEGSPNDITPVMAPVDHGGFNYLRAAQHLQAATTPPNLYIIRNRHRPWVHPKPSSENIHATPEQPLNANNAFIFVGNDTAKRGLKAAPPIIPNFKPHHLPPPPTDSESPEQETVFEKIHTAESSQYLSKRTHTYQPPTTPPSEAGGVIRKTLEAPRRGSRSAKARGDQPQRRAKSCKTRPPAAATPEIQSDYRSDQTVNVDATDWACVAQTFTAAAGAYESPRASYSKVPVVPQVQYDNAQLENGSLSLCELEFESESSHVGFDLSFSFGLDLLPRREYEDLIRPTFTTSHENFWSPEGYSYGTDDFQSSPNS